MPVLLLTSRNVLFTFSLLSALQVITSHDFAFCFVPFSAQIQWRYFLPKRGLKNIKLHKQVDYLYPEG